jgi:putative porin
MKLRSMIMGVAALCTALVLPAKPAHAQTDSALLDALVKKGVLSDQDAEDIRASEEKDYASTAASKINLSTSIKSITFYGDLRLRFELRDGVTPAGLTGTGGAPLAHGDTQTDDRWRYRLRFGFKGDLYDNFFYGVRLATNPNYDRSGNVTFGHSNAEGPFGKDQSLIAIDQVFLGWKPTDWLTLTGGQMPNPFYTTNLIWDDNLNPTGAAEQFDKTFDNTEVFATLGQFVYQAAAGNGLGNTLGATQNFSNTFMYAEEVGFKYKFDESTFFKGAAAFYTYSGTQGNTETTVAGLYSGGPLTITAPNNSPSFFNGPFVGAGSAPETNVSGINNLAVLETPMEFDFKIGPGIHTVTSGDPKDMKDMTSTTTGWTLPVRIFADFAYNFEADERADAARAAITSAGVGANNTAATSNTGITAGTPLGDPTIQGVLNSGKGFLDQSAYQVGVEVGQLKKKGDLDGKLYWMSTGYYAVDPNLVDADIFNAATNMQGVVVSAAYNWTDGLTSTVRYAYAMPVNGRLATPNVNQDLQEGDIRQYNLFQADLQWKF